MAPISNSQNPGAEVVPQPLKNIDWIKLRRQKKWLLMKLNEANDGMTKGRITGLLNLVDAIQEYACEELGKDPALVWGKEATEGANALGEFLEEEAA